MSRKKLSKKDLEHLRMTQQEVNSILEKIKNVESRIDNASPGNRAVSGWKKELQGYKDSIKIY